MKVIRTKIHGMLDYPIGLGILLMPWIFGFNSNGFETLVPILLGTLFVVFSIITNYEWGMAKYISMNSHLFLDGIIGTVLCFSPWLFGFESIAYWPHVIGGLAIILLVLFSSNTPYLRLYYTGVNSSYSIRNL